MRLIILLAPLLLAACSLPGRQTLAPNPPGADTSTIDATQAFAGRVPLVTILPGTQDFAGPVASAVHQALAIKPDAQFDVEAQIPAAASPDTSADDLKQLGRTASAVAKSIVADGVPKDRVSVTAKTAGLTADILVYVK
ncbi:MAG: hypothetical protein B7Z80_03825 [Rhodospirillales bacterium 20-64-7]|nr:MAG: hypothetical protein B7Z80_03825 [Rhodospirillales bacterium 20-64-7]